MTRGRRRRGGGTGYQIGPGHARGTAYTMDGLCRGCTPPVRSTGARSPRTSPWRRPNTGRLVSCREMSRQQRRDPSRPLRHPSRRVREVYGDELDIAHADRVWGISRKGPSLDARAVGQVWARVVPLAVFHSTSTENLQPTSRSDIFEMAESRPASRAPRTTGEDRNEW